MKRLLVLVFAIMPLLAFATDEICPAGYYPAEYIELEYIESTGTQYIDTGLYANQDTRAIIDFKIDEFLGNTTARMFGAAYDGNMNKYAFALGAIYLSQKRFAVGYENQIINGVMSDTAHHIIDINKNYTYLDGALIYSHTYKTFTTNSTLYIGNVHLDIAGGMNNPQVKVIWYNIEIYSNSNMLRDFIPVRRESDGAVGMFDKVEGKFYGNDGAGEFIAGPEIGQSFIVDENGDITCVSCPANTYKPNAGNEQCTKCPEHTFSPVGSKELGDCAKILRVKDYVVYMPLGKRTEHGLCVMVDGKKYCADVYERQ